MHAGPVGLPAAGEVSIVIPNPLGADHLGPVLGTVPIGTFPGMFVAAGTFLAAALALFAVRYRASAPA